MYQCTSGVNGAKKRNILLNSLGRDTKKLYGCTLNGIVYEFISKRFKQCVKRPSRKTLTKFTYLRYLLLTVAATAAKRTFPL